MLVFDFVPKPAHLGGTSGVVPFFLASVLGIPLVYYLHRQHRQSVVEFVLAGICVGLIPSAFYLIMDFAYGGDAPYLAMAGIGVICGAIAGRVIAAIFAGNL
jgi:hypothetical protein